MIFYDFGTVTATLSAITAVMSGALTTCCDGVTLKSSIFRSVAFNTTCATILFDDTTHVTEILIHSHPFCGVGLYLCVACDFSHHSIFTLQSHYLHFLSVYVLRTNLSLF